MEFAPGAQGSQVRDSKEIEIILPEQQNPSPNVMPEYHMNLSPNPI